MIELNSIELKYLELKNKTIQVSEFENWIYNNEDIIRSITSDSIYDDLIILNYRNNHAERYLSKILSIDFDKLKRFELQEILKNLIKSDSFELNEVCHNLYDSIYDPYSRLWFGFNINNVEIGLNYPFKYESEFNKLSDKERGEKFIKEFKNPKAFFENMLLEIESQNIKVVVNENLGDIDSNNFTEAISGTKEDLSISIGKHRIIVNKEYLSIRMKNYWQK